MKVLQALLATVVSFACCATILAHAPSAAVPSDTNLSQLTKEEVQKRLKEVEQSSQIAEAAKADLLKRYRQALEWLAAADQSAAKIAAANADAVEAPRRIDEIKRQRSDPAVDATVQAPPDARLSDLEKSLTQSEARLIELRESLARLEADVKRRTELKTRLPKLIADASQALEQVRMDLAAPATVGESPEAALARRTEHQAHAIALEQELAGYQAVARQNPAVAELAPLALDLAQRDATRAEKQAAAWRKIVADRRKLESENQARAARRDVAKTHPALKQLAQRNAALAERRRKVAAEIERTAAERTAVESQLAALTAEFATTREKVEIAGLTSTVGLILRHQRTGLPDLSQRRQRLDTIAVEAPRLQLELLELADERQSVRDLDAAVARELQGLDVATRRSLSDEAAGTIRELLQARRDYLDALLGDYQTYLEHLGALELGARKLVAQADSFADYLAENVLWVRSMEPVRTADISEFGHAVAELAARTGALASPQGTARQFGDHPGESAAWIVAFPLLLFLRRRVRARLRRLGELSASASRQRFGGTFQVLLLTIVLASIWPGMIGLAAWRLAALEPASELISAFAAGLSHAAIVYWTAELVRTVCRARGLAELHFGWPARSLSLFRRHLTRAMTVGIPIVLLATWLERLHDRSGVDPSGRILFIAGMIVVAMFAQRIFSARHGIYATGGWGTATAWQRLRNVWHVLAVVTPLALALLAGVGYYYTAQQLASRLESSTWLLLGLVTLHALVLRWVVLVGRRLRIRQALEQHQAGVRAAAEGSSMIHHGSTKLALSAPLNVAAVSLQVRQLLSAGLAVGLLVGGWVVWRDVLPALRVLDRVPLWTRVVEQTQTISGPSGEPQVRKIEREVPTSLGHLAIAVVVVGGGVLAWRNIPGLLQITVLQKLPLNHGGRHAATALSRYVVLVAAGVAAFRLVGIGWSSVQWLAAAMTVGLGFGLQEIFANFVSGLIILFERPVRVGDIVTVGGGTGTVTQIRMRATTITDSDRKEFIVPNKKFITDEVINWTLSDPITRVVIRVGIAYGSDTQLAQRLLLRAAKKHPLVVDEPEPTALFAGFGPSTLDFELRAFIPNRDAHATVLHDLNTAIDRSFRDAKIEIAFPQQDLHIRSLPPVLAQHAIKPTTEAA